MADAPVLRRWLAFGGAAIAGLQALVGTAMTAAAALGAVAGVGFTNSMCTGGLGCEGLGTLLAKAALLVALVGLVLVVAPGTVAIGLLKSRRWAPGAGIAIELALAAGTGAWLADQQPALPAYYTLGIPIVAGVAAALIAGSVFAHRFLGEGRGMPVVTSKT